MGWKGRDNYNYFNMNNEEFYAIIYINIFSQADIQIVQYCFPDLENVQNHIFMTYSIRS